MSNINEFYSQQMSHLKAASVNQEYAGGILETPIFEDAEVVSAAVAVQTVPEPERTRVEQVQDFAKQFSYTTDIGKAASQVTQFAFNKGFEKLGVDLGGSGRLGGGKAATKAARAMKRVK